MGQVKELLLTEIICVQVVTVEILAEVVPASSINATCSAFSILILTMSGFAVGMAGCCQRAENTIASLEKARAASCHIASCPVWNLSHTGPSAQNHGSWTFELIGIGVDAQSMIHRWVTLISSSEGNRMAGQSLRGNAPS